MTELPNGEKFVSMVLYKDILIVCSCSKVYQFINNELVPIRFAESEE